MRAVLQRVSEASVEVDGAIVGQTGPGLLILLGVGHGDTPAEAQLLAEKTAGLRIFADDEGKFNRSLLDTGGGALVVSQFTLYADTRRGRRPGFSEAAPPAEAAPLVDAFCTALGALGVPVERGVFGASMRVRLTNEGPVTIILDSDTFKQPRR
ncbi:MAG: D-aminoacyl-tRNA deacylase [Chloroflexi bacterium OHK40]